MFRRRRIKEVLVLVLVMYEYDDPLCNIDDDEIVSAEGLSYFHFISFRVTNVNGQPDLNCRSVTVMAMAMAMAMVMIMMAVTWINLYYILRDSCSMMNVSLFFLLSILTNPPLKANLFKPFAPCSSEKLNLITGLPLQRLL